MDENDNQNNLDKVNILPCEMKWTRAHPLHNAIGDANAGIKTRSASANFCLYSSFLSKIEPKKVCEALEDPDWILAMQDELLQFKENKVWRLVLKPADNQLLELNGSSETRKMKHE